jgi:hypothetical protein
LKCGAGEGRRSVGPIVREMKYYKEPRRRDDNLETIERRKTNWTGNMLRRNCLLKCVIEGKIEIRIEGTGIRGRDVSSYWVTLRNREVSGKEALDSILWRTRVGRGCEPVVS